MDSRESIFLCTTTSFVHSSPCQFILVCTDLCHSRVIADHTSDPFGPT